MRNMLRFASVVVLVVFLPTTIHPAYSQASSLIVGRECCHTHGAHCSHGDEQVLLPPGATVWDPSDFVTWLDTQDEETRAWGDKTLVALSEYERPLILVFRRSDWEAWQASQGNEHLRVHDPTVLARTGRDLPAYLQQELGLARGTDRKGGAMPSFDMEEEVVIVLVVPLLCWICGILVSAFIGWLLSRFVFDPTYEWMKAKWE